MKGLSAVLAVLAAGLWLMVMVGMYWLMEILPVTALFGLAAYYAVASSRPGRVSRP